MLYYITSNKEKLRVAAKYLLPFDVKVEGKHLEFVEMQSDDIAEIAIQKAKQAYKEVGQPLFVNDAGWYITALGGFPGPFMKYINQWLTSSDLLKLMAGLDNREIIFREVICYIDQNQTKTFVGEIKGVVLGRDTAPTEVPSRSIISLSSSHKSIAECWAAEIPSVDDYKIWEEFAKWYGYLIDMEVKAALASSLE